MHNLTAVFLASDECMGKADISLLSDQTRMELLFQGMFIMAWNSSLKAEDGGYANCCAWDIVKCDADENVTVIDCRQNGFDYPDGSLEVKMIPLLVQKFDVQDFLLKGTLDLAALPSAMQEFIVSQNAFSGTIDLTGLPESLQVLALSENALSGTIDLSALPLNLHVLELNDNKLSGGLDLESLPKSLRTLILSNNGFTGELSLIAFADHGAYVDISCTNLSGTVTVPLAMRANVYLDRDKIDAVVDMEGLEWCIDRSGLVVRKIEE